MASTLIEIWRDQGSFIAGKSFRQIIQLAGDGRLRDGNGASQELREWLSAIPLERLRLCIEECLSDSFDDAALALQDATNELGVRLGFKVTPGRYRGIKGDVGNDGLWHADDGFTLLVEVKTTDAYRINLDTIAGYRERLIASQSVDAQQCSILIAVGRQETGDLEAQIRGSRHAWDIRLISLEALLRLAEVKEELSDWDTSNKINQLLRPVEYTRLDGIVELLFAAKQDLETPPAVTPPAELNKTSKPETISPKELEIARDAAVARIGMKLGCTFVRRGRALRASSDGNTRLVCLASQRYEGPSGSGNYWYGFTTAQRSFLLDAKQPYVAMVCADSGDVFLIEWRELQKWLPELWTTPPAPSREADIRHWHLYFNDYGTRADLMKAGGGLLRDIATFRI
jgi:hypothetical protein